MNRLNIIQRIIDSTNAKSYLEIGVNDGAVLFNVKVSMKYGVDPEFKFNLNDKIDRKLSFEGGHLYELNSDDFFEVYASQDLKEGIDVAFVDGLHTYNQSLKDVLNCLSYLNSGGVIIMHDCNPLSFATAYSVKESINEAFALANLGEIPGWNGNWNGDVWKALVHLRVENDGLEIFTLDLDWGLGIITKGHDKKLQGVSLKDIQEADYSFLEKNRGNLLNLKHPKYIDVFLEKIKM